MLGKMRQLIHHLITPGGDPEPPPAGEPAKQIKQLTTELHRSALLLAGAQSLNQALESIPNTLILTQDGHGRILSINSHGLWLAGYTQTELVGRLFATLLPDAALLPDLGFRLEELPRSGHHLDHQTELIRKDGNPLAIQWHHAVYDCPINSKCLLTIGIDISDQKIAEDHLGWLAAHDPLTGLYNRRRFLEELGQTIATCERYGQSFAVMVIDLDQFKDINESSGHHVGDRLLQRASDTLRYQARTSDILSRLGDDEFAVIVQMTGADSAELIAKRFCAALNELEVKGNNSDVYRVSASIGVAMFPAHGANPDELLANADIALYQAKEKGRQTWHIFTPEEHTRTRLHERAYWDGKVRKALTGNHIYMHFQPILDVRQNEISHYEALLRVKDEAGTPLAADRFISSAERSGLIHNVDERVITSVLESLANLHSKKIKARLSINLSGMSFHNPNLVKHIRESIAEYAVDPACIIFEITETAAVADIDAACQIMRQIKSLGCQFALDDFGVGFSSLFYLKKLPIDYVKIDGSFIRNLHRDSDSQVLVRAVVEVAKTYRLQTVAEFVENTEILAVLQVLGVDFAQGYHIDQPKAFDSIWPTTGHAVH